jgi:hypothetical protein
MTLALWAGPAFAQVAPGAPERRLALVIGNDAYPVMPLRNVVNDARAADGSGTWGPATFNCRREFWWRLNP